MKELLIAILIGLLMAGAATPAISTQLPPKGHWTNQQLPTI